MRRFQILSFLLSFFAAAKAQPTFQTRTVKDNLFIPWEILWAPDNHIWFTQKNGFICRLDPDNGQTDTLWHQTNTVVNGEGGMLGMAVHPQLLTTHPYAYVAYEYESGGLYLQRIQRLTYDAGTNTLGNPLTLVDSIPGASIHNGCRLMIAENYLFVSTGDAAVSSRAQNINALNGKIIRLNLDGSVPVDNPVAGSFVYSWGHRNAQGLVFANDRIYSSEHGPSTDDEINILLKGRNYGWPIVHGYCDEPDEMAFCADSNVVAPLQVWTPTIAPSGIDYYDHPMFPAWQKSILMTTLKDSRLYRLKLSSSLDGIDSVILIDGVSFGRLRDVCISPEGRVFISTSNSSPSGSGAFIDKIIELADSSFTGVGMLQEKNAGFTLSPNPVTHTLRVTFENPLPEVTAYYVLDGQGRVIQQGTWSAGSLAKEINLDQLPAGSYWLRVGKEGQLSGTLAFQKN